ncbi:MAG: nucleotidyltransferase family protein [Bacteroidales bacterium]|nr:nucleotidyltransferase family protein [Bacteroidales bacterium]
MVNEIDIVFALLRASLSGKAPEVERLEASQWWNLFRLLQANHVSALTAEALATLEVPREVKIPWLAECDKAVRWHRYQQEVQQDIVDTMTKHGIETLVLKGTHTAQYYPHPETREFGDLDLYFYDRHDEADRVAREVLRVDVSNDAHHHSKYNYRGVTVESHYDFVNRHYPPSNRRYETLLKELAPGPTFEVLFLLRHMAGHFAASRITLRDLVDWTLTCRALNDKVDWDKVERAIHDFGMTKYATMLNSIAESRLGSQPLSYSDTQSLIEHDIVYGSMDDNSADGVGRLGWKLRRWRALGWKRKMVYNDNTLRLFLASMTSHTMKPQSILHKM